MNPLLDNFIGSMRGPAFLLFYICIAVVTLVLCRLRRQAADPSRHAPPLPLPSDPEPHEIAYVRGGANELIRVVILDLIQRQFLRYTETPKRWFKNAEQKIERHPDAPPPKLLTPVEREVMSVFTGPKNGQEVFESGMLTANVERHCGDYLRRMSEEQLLSPPETKQRAVRIGLAGAAVLLGLAGYKLTAAILTQHYNVGFLIVLTFVSVVVLAFLCAVPRLSARGREYVLRLQQVFEQLKQERSYYGKLGPDPRILLLVSLFGVGMLADTPHDIYRKMFVQSSSGGCGGGCGGGGGGGCGGGGCGGGCGGCGG